MRSRKQILREGKSRMRAAQKDSSKGEVQGKARGWGWGWDSGDLLF